MRPLRHAAGIALGLCLAAWVSADGIALAKAPPRSSASSKGAQKAGGSRSRGQPAMKESAALLPKVDPERIEDEEDVSEAILDAERTLADRERTLGPADPQIADALFALGVLRRKKFDFDAAEPLLKRAAQIREKALGPDALEVADALYQLAVVRRKKRAYDGTEEIFLRALRVREKKKGGRDPAVAEVLTDLGLFYRRRLQYDRAVLAFERAISIREDAFGHDSIELADPENHLAMIHWARGEYADAEPLLTHVLALREKALGPEHPDVAGVLKNLGIVYRDEGQYDRAVDLFKRSISIIEAAFGPDHPDVSPPVYNLGVLNRKQNHLAQAEALFKRALAVSEQALGPDHPDVADILTDLGSLYSQRGSFDRAVPLLTRAVAVFEKAYGMDHPEVARAVSSLGLVDVWRGDLKTAEPLLLRALSIQEQTAGVDSPDVARTLSYLAGLYLLEGRFADAVRMRARGGAIREHLADLTLDSGSELQKSQYVATLQKDTDATVSLHAFSAPSNPDAARLALTTILRRKGRILDTMADSVRTLRSHLQPEDRGLLDRRSTVLSELARQAAHADTGAPADEQLAALRRLDDERQKLEEEISRRSAEFRADQRPVSTEEVAEAIPKGQALIEIFRYRPFEAREGSVTDHWGDPRYVAYRLLHDGGLEGIDLGEAAPIDALVSRLREALSNPTRDPKPAARALDQAVMQPVRRLLGGVRDVWVSPDGALNLVPFGALIDESGRYLVDRYCFTYMTSGRDLIRLQESASPHEVPVVVANPRFGPFPTDGAPSKDRGTFAGVLFPPLAGTTNEATVIGKRLPGSTVLLGDAATETRIKALHGPRIVHIATHGFFLPEPSDGNAKAPAGGATRGASGPAAGSGPAVQGTSSPPPAAGGVPASASPPAASGAPAVSGAPAAGSADPKASTAPRVIDNPLLRAGLAFAGANERRSGADDGILTALEASALDLYGTKLVVLSACETGIGDVSYVHGDGVYGLRRALVMAGAETQVMSLWKVDDDATRRLMEAYYARLDAGVGRSEAMRDVERQIARSKGTAHPYYWAGFIVSGASTPLGPDHSGVPPVRPGLRGSCACSEVGGASGDGGAATGGISALLGCVALGLMAARRHRRLVARG